MLTRLILTDNVLLTDGFTKLCGVWFLSEVGLWVSALNETKGQICKETKGERVNVH